MKIDDLIHLLDNRLREFQLARDYARMSGNLERMNIADKEVIALEDTLYQLNLLVDTSKSAAVKENTLKEVITDGSVAVLGEYDITSYATDPKHEEKVMNILSKMGVMDTVEKIDDYIRSKALSSPVTGEMVMSASLAYDVDTRLIMAIMEQDSRFGTAGLAVRTLNPGNVGNDDDGNIRTYDSWQEGVTAVAEWLSRHRGETIIPEIPEEIITEPTATSTPNQDSSGSSGTGQATSTPITSTSTPITATSTTTTVINIPTTGSTPLTASSSPQTVPTIVGTPTKVGATSTPITSTGSTPLTASSSPQTVPAIVGTPTKVGATSTPITTSTPNQDSSGSSGTGQATTTPETSTATSTPVVESSADTAADETADETPN